MKFENEVHTIRGTSKEDVLRQLDELLGGKETENEAYKKLDHKINQSRQEWFTILEDKLDESDALVRELAQAYALIEAVSFESSQTLKRVEELEKAAVMNAKAMILIGEALASKLEEIETRLDKRG